MNEKEFKKLVRKDLYQVFLFFCPVSFPYSLGLHNWFVTNKKGKIDRWEVLLVRDAFRTNKDEILFERDLVNKKQNIVSERKDYVYKNILKPTDGVNKYMWRLYPLREGSLLGMLAGTKNSLSYKMVDFISKNAFKYPLKSRYSVFGPNSNTFIQWIINKFPKSGFKLSWRAFGKNYKIK